MRIYTRIENRSNHVHMHRHGAVPFILVWVKAEIGKNSAGRNVRNLNVWTHFGMSEKRWRIRCWPQRTNLIFGQNKFNSLASSNNNILTEILSASMVTVKFVVVYQTKSIDTDKMLRQIIAAVTRLRRQKKSEIWYFKKRRFFFKRVQQNKWTATTSNH